MASDDEIMKRYMAGDWIDGNIVESNDALRKRMAQHAAVWSVAKDAYRIKSAFAAEEAVRS